MKYYYYYSLSLLYLAVAIFLFPSTANARGLCEAIAKADPKNVSYNFCVSEVEEERLFSQNKTAPQLGVLSFSFTLWRTDALFYRIHKVSEEVAALNQSTKDALKDCLDLYSGVPDDLQQGRSAVKAGDFKTAGIKAGAAMAASATCGKKIKNTRDTSESISAVLWANNNIHQLAAVSLGFAKLLPIVN